MDEIVAKLEALRNADEGLYLEAIKELQAALNENQSPAGSEQKGEPLQNITELLEKLQESKSESTNGNVKISKSKPEVGNIAIGNEVLAV